MTAVPVYDAHPWTDESAPVSLSSRRAKVVADYARAARRDDWRAEAMAVPEDVPHPLGRFPELWDQIAIAEERDNRGPTMLGWVLLVVSLAAIAAVVWRVWNGGW